MSPIPNFENHLFISYAHLDNETLSKEHEGWISMLHKWLEIRVSQVTGVKGVKIWRDEKLQGNDVFGEEIISRLRGSAILISILTPGYVNSEWCLRELNAFFDEAGDSLQVGSKLRVFKVLKTPVPLDKHPSKLQGVLGYEFYEIIDPETGKAREFIPDPDKDNRYWERLDDLAWGVKALIENLPRDDQDKPAPRVAASGLSIYLATTTSDLADRRDEIKRELERRGHTVMPDQDLLPLSGEKLRETIKTYLQSCQLSVHLIGERYGMVPEMEDRSLIQLQQELAAERGDDHAFSRIIWIPPEIAPKDERQRQFIANLQNSFSSHNGSELLQTKLEDLKTIIQQKIEKRLKPPPATASMAADDLKRVYLICDQMDDESIEPLTKHLFDQGVEVILALRDDDQSEVKQFHKDQLSICDGVLIYYGQAKSTWMMMNLNELRKLPAYRGSKPLPVKAIFIGGVSTSHKDSFRTLEATIIRHYGDFSPDAIAPFIEQVKATKGAQPQ
jgi:hypothetical protein